MATQFACSPETGEAIARAARERQYAPAAVIVRQGERPSEVFLVMTGHAEAALVTADGRLVRLLAYGCGDLFGAFGEPLPALADVVAANPVEAAAFLAPAFGELAERHACVGYLLARSLVRQLAMVADQFVARLTLSATGRVHAELLRLARLGDGRTISPVPVLAELASNVQTTRETVSRTVSMLERRGLLRREEGALVLVAPHRLEELVI